MFYIRNFRNVGAAANIAGAVIELKKKFNTKKPYKRKTSGAALHISSNKFISKLLA